MSKKNTTHPYSDETRVVTAGRTPSEQAGSVNPPVYHASTILFDTVEELLAHKTREGGASPYGRLWTPGTKAFEDAMAALEGGDVCRLAPSGYAAVTCALLSYTRAGGHVLMTDSVYEPVRNVCKHLLKRHGVETTFYDPLIGEDIRALIRPETQVVFLESPGSRTFEIQDVPVIAEIARQTGAVSMMDNTWATPFYFKPLAHGVDVSIQAATKFIAGHSDVLIGTITTHSAISADLHRGHVQLGLCAGPDDVYLAQRGLRTLAVRMRRHFESGLEIAHWLRARPEVKRVIHPALPDDPGHALWKRDFTGASGLFAAELHPASQAQMSAFYNGLELFGLGYSFGGYESLIVPTELAGIRASRSLDPAGPLCRIHVGLEDPADLIADLDAGFARLHAAA